MDNSNQPAANPAPESAAPAPQPVVPKASAPAASNSVVPSGKPGSSKGLIIGLIIGGVAIIGIALLCIFLIPALGGVDWEKTNEAADSFLEVNNNLYSDCSDANIYVSSTTKGKETYNQFIDKCQEATDKYVEFVKTLKDVSGVKKNDEIKKKYEAFEAAYKEGSPYLEGRPALFKAIHEVMISLNSFSSSSDFDDLTDAKLSEILSPLRNMNSNDTINSLGEEMATKIEDYYKIVRNYYEAYQLYWDTPYSDSNFDSVKAAYEKAREAYYDAELEIDTDSIEDKLDKLDNTGEDLYKEMKNQYNKNN